MTICNHGIAGDCPICQSDRRSAAAERELRDTQARLTEATALLERCSNGFDWQQYDSAIQNDIGRDLQTFLSRAPAVTQCPTCTSPQPNLHPAVQDGGEVQPCPDAWHQRPAWKGGAIDRAPAPAAEQDTGAVSRTYHDRLQLQLERQRDEHMRRAEAAEAPLAAVREQVERHDIDDVDKVGYIRDLLRAKEGT